MSVTVTGICELQQNILEPPVTSTGRASLTGKRLVMGIDKILLASTSIDSPYLSNSLSIPLIPDQFGFQTEPSLADLNLQFCIICCACKYSSPTHSNMFLKDIQRLKPHTYVALRFITVSTNSNCASLHQPHDPLIVPLVDDASIVLIVFWIICVKLLEGVTLKTCYLQNLRIKDILQT